MRTWSCLLCVLAIAPASAADFSQTSFGDQPLAVGAGARALGLGGAFSAIADDTTASTWNPAGLTQCERPESALSLDWYTTTVDAGSGGNGTGQTVRPEHLSVMLPFFASGCQQVIGLAWQRQYDFTLHQSTAQRIDYSDPDFQIITDRQADIVRSGGFASLGLSYAIEARPGLSLGATLNAWGDRWTRSSGYRKDTISQETTTTSVFGFDTIDQSSWNIREDATVRSGTSVVAGVWYQATPALTLALVVKPGYRLKLDDEQHWRVVHSDGVGSTIVTETTSASDATLHHPPSATLGLAWRQADTDTISLDTIWTRWRLYYLENAAGRRSPVNSLVDPGEFPDLWTFRAGYEHIAILSDFVLVPRCGAMVESLPTSTRAPSAAALDQVSPARDLWLGAAAGLSLCRRSTVWDAAVQVRHGDNVGTGQFADAMHTADVTLVTARLGVTVQF